MAKVHHNTLKRAKAHGIELIATETGFNAVHNGEVLADAPDAKDALDLAILNLAEFTPKKAKKAKPAKKAKAKKARRKSDDEDGDEGENGDEDEGDEDEGDEDEGKSIVKRKYKTAYRPHHDTNGTTLAQNISAHVRHVNGDGEERVDPAKLKRFAKANECWVASYAALNIGQQRMSVGNRLRAKVKKGHEVIWS